jgi:hypothetical protein
LTISDDAWSTILGLLAVLVLVFANGFFVAAEFELRSRRAGDAVGWDLVVTATGETYPFRTEVGSPARDWVLVSEANVQGVDPGVRTPMTPRREDGTVAADGNGVARLSFLHLAQGFIAQASGRGASPGRASPHRPASGR